MANSASLLKEINSYQKQLNAMTPADPTEAYRAFSQQMGDLAPQYAELRGMQTQAQQAIPSLMNQYLQQYGGTAGPSALSRLADIMGQTGRINNTAQVMGDVIGQRKQTISDLANQAINMYNQQIAAKQQQYQNAYGLYQTALQQEEAARQRALQKQLAYAGMGGGGGGTEKTTQTKKTDPYATVQPATIKQGERYMDANGVWQTNNTGKPLTIYGTAAMNYWNNKQEQQMRQAQQNQGGLFDDVLKNNLFTWGANALFGNKQNATGSSW